MSLIYPGDPGYGSLGREDMDDAWHAAHSDVHARYDHLVIGKLERFNDEGPAYGSAFHRG